MEAKGCGLWGEFLSAFITILAPLKLKRTRVLGPVSLVKDKSVHVHIIK